MPEVHEHLVLPPPNPSAPPGSRNHASILPSDPSSSPASVPPSGHHRSTQTCPNPQVRGEGGSSVYWSDSLRCACMYAQLR
jgi:hypothetical protein